MPLSCRFELPGIVGRQVKFTGPTRDADTAAYAHQPVVFCQRLPGFARQAVQRLKTDVKLSDHRVKHTLGNGRVAAVSIQMGFLLVQVFKDIGFEIGACAHIHDFKQGGQRKVVVHRRFASQQLAESDKQMFQPQIGANALVKGVFVKDHANSQ